jgi:hypothetical protein
MANLNPKAALLSWCRAQGQKTVPPAVIEPVFTYSNPVDDPRRWLCTVSVRLPVQESGVALVSSPLAATDKVLSEETITITTIESHERKKSADTDACKQLLALLSMVIPATPSEAEYAIQGMSAQLAKLIMTTVKDLFGRIPSRLPHFDVRYQNVVIDFPKKSRKFAMFSELLFNSSITSQLRQILGSDRRCAPYLLYEALRNQLLIVWADECASQGLLDVNISFDFTCDLFRSIPELQLTFPTSMYAINLVEEFSQLGNGEKLDVSAARGRELTAIHSETDALYLVNIVFLANMARKQETNPLPTEDSSLCMQIHPHTAQIDDDPTIRLVRIPSGETEFHCETLYKYLTELLHGSRILISPPLFRVTYGHVSHVNIPEYRIFVSFGEQIDQLRLADDKIDAGINDDNTRERFRCNALASWLAGSAILGPACILDTSTYRLNDVAAPQFQALLLSSLPSGAWLTKTVRRELHGLDPSQDPVNDAVVPVLPNCYVPEWWKQGGFKTLTSLLSEIVLRRHGSPKHTEDTAGKHHSHIGSLVSTTAKDDGTQLVQLKLPDNTEAFGSAAGQIFSVIIKSSKAEPDKAADDCMLTNSGCVVGMKCSSCVVMVCNRRVAEEVLALKALWAVEYAGRYLLQGGRSSCKHGNRTRTIHFQIPVVDCVTEAPPVGSTPTDRDVQQSLSVQFMLTNLTVATSDVVCRTYTGIGLIHPKWEQFFSSCELDKSYNVRFAECSTRELSPQHPETAATVMSALWSSVPALTAIVQLGTEVCPSNNNTEMYHVKVLDRISLTAFRKLVAVKLKDNKPIFCPSLAKQRINLVADLLNKYNVNSWIDLGCGEAKLALNCFVDVTVMKTFNATKVPVSAQDIPQKDILPSTELGEDLESEESMLASLARVSPVNAATGVRKFVGLDLTLENIHLAAKSMKQLGDCIDLVHHEDNRLKEPQIKMPLMFQDSLKLLQLESVELGVMNLLHLSHALEQLGDIADSPPPNHVNADMVTCIEVIEHLPSVADAVGVAVSVLTHLHPKMFLLSTPNYEANELIARAASTLEAGEMAYREQPCFINSGLSERTFRETDHKFEFTRQEFRNYIDNVVLTARSGATCSCSYTVAYLDVGTSLLGMDHTGGATQFALLTRLCVDTSTDADRGTVDDPYGFCSACRKQCSISKGLLQKEQSQNTRNVCSVLQPGAWPYYNWKRRQLK